MRLAVDPWRARVLAMGLEHARLRRPWLSWLSFVAEAEARHERKLRESKGSERA